MLTLQQPLAFLDLETTGTDPQRDRIIEIAIVKLLPTGDRDQFVHRLNPGLPIPPEATAIHNITDEDVADKPRFPEIADDLLEFIEGCDLCGFNLKRFDLKVLYAEFKRIPATFPIDAFGTLDVMEIYHAREPRNLSTAVRFYCDREHTEAHSAEADVVATMDVLFGMLGRYSDLPRTVDGLIQAFKPANAVDAEGNFIRVSCEIRFTFGKHRGQPLDAIAQREPTYLQWMLGQDFLDDVKTLVREALQRCSNPAGD